MTTPRKKLGHLIRTARATKGWTQQQLADEVNVSRQGIASYEAGRTWPQATHAHALSRALGIDIPEEPHAGPIQTPPKFSAEDARGVRYAALQMSRTLTRLLEEANDVERLAEREARERELDAQALATHLAATRNHPAHRTESARPKKSARG